MYFPGSQACSQPNSETPMPQSWIDRQNAFIESVSTAFDDGNQTLNDLLQTLGGNPAGDTVSGAQGVATTGTLDTSLPGIPVVPDSQTAAPIAVLPDVNNPGSWSWPTSPELVPGGAAGKPNRMHAAPRRYLNVGIKQGTTPNSNPPENCPIVVPLVAAIPIPQTLPVPAAPAAATPPKAAAPPANAPQTDCRTGNICLDLMNGCVLSSQVTPAQLAACSAAGYAGNRNLFPAIAAKGGANGGAFLGAPNLSPAPYSPGMSGFGQADVQAANAGFFDNIFEGVVTAVATAAALAILWRNKKSF
jgi:hypothetical protein